MKYRYPSEKFTTAINCLATSASPIQERISNAYASSLMRIKADEIPEDCRSRFETIQEKLNSCEPERHGEGRIHASARNLSNTEAEQIATDIFDIFTSIESSRLYD